MEVGSTAIDPEQLTPTTVLPERPGMSLGWAGLAGSSDMLAVVALAQKVDQLCVVITQEPGRSDRWQHGIGFYTNHDGTELANMRFPDWETLPYDAFSPHQDIISERLSTLQSLRSATKGVLTVPVSTLMQKVPPLSYLDGACFELSCGQTFDTAAQRLRLEAAGYQSVETVTERGQYAVRGALMDVYPMGAKLPVRIDLLDDEIDTLRTFDPDSQRTVERIDSLSLLPAKEFPFDDDAIAGFRRRWHDTFQVDVRQCSIYQDVSSYITPNGVEYYLPLFFDELASLFDYLPESAVYITEAGVAQAAKNFEHEIESRYESLRHDVERPIFSPSTLYLSSEELNQKLNQHPRVHLDDGPSKHQRQFRTWDLPALGVNPKAENPAADLQRFVAEQSKPVLFVAESAGRREVLDELLRKSQIHAKSVDGFVAWDKANPTSICVGPIEEGMILDSGIIICESQVLGSRPGARRKENGKRVIDPDQIVRNLTELTMGAPVVHMEHGVGRYLGLQTLTIDNNAEEFLTLGYAGDAKLYVPVTSLHLIGRYAGADEEHAPLHRLGSDQWERAKKKAAEKVIDVAAELLDIYARRAAKKSHQLQANQSDYEVFAQEFGFEVTPDQAIAIEETLADMAQEQAMDRLVCGDVGFGKTEVAMRAAFVAVQSGKQVILLVPTTLLAQQHFESFRDRFANWPVTIDVVSRQRTQSEIDDIAQRCSSGKLDILIGTHKLLSPEFRYQDLGLVIIDEEHRFGVRQKERLRAMRAEVDVLTLTATPIPRTLNMSLSGLRDLSIIATPPAKRLSIKTFVQPQREQGIKEAITRELMRGGQIFYLHNEVRSIEQAASDLEALVPEARVGVAHGQMRSNEMEQVMNEFYHRRLNVLVCTTIIETGIDIPNANTIIIERADKFGLAQLHQLRGRVGRSHRQAYAYLLTPDSKSMTGDAIKRLEAIEAAGELGVGFTLATQDMEIRGTGELLGDDQSGQIESIGFSLYMDMLNRAVEALRSGKIPDRDMPLEPVSQEVNLHVAALIPEDYLPDVQSRLILYKRIAGAGDQQELDDLKGEIIDRFGLLPISVQNLFVITSLKLQAQALGIIKVDIGDTKGKLEFSKTTTVEPIAIVRLVQQQANTYRLDGASTLRIEQQLAEFQDRVAFVEELFEVLSAKAA
jgi:transcription-repair coupling factor (superfamily II helicase)